MKAKRKETWSVAESCTGGAIANAITDVSGASRYFKCGIVAYSNEAKIRFLGVSKNTLKKFGAVSGEVAKEMAEGMRKHFKTTRALAVTGIAGPTGGTKEKPVGTVYIALATAAKTEVKHFCFAGGRIPFKKIVTATALKWLRKKRL